MKRKKLAALPIALGMACCLSYGAMTAMITGLNLPVERMDRLCLAWALCALAGCVIFLFSKGWIAALVTGAAGLGWLWQTYYLSLPLRALITRLSWIYDSAYGWGMLEFAGVNWSETTLDLPLGVWGCLIALTAAGTVMQGRGLTLTLVLSLLPVFSTMVVTNTVPAPASLYLLMLGVILLVLTATVRRQSPGQGAKLTAMAFAPMALLLGLLFHSYPQDTYVNRSEEYLDSVVAWWQNTATFSADNAGLMDRTPATPNASATANLSRVGPRNTWAYTVFEAAADYSGTVYLRGQDFDTYDGLSWAATEDRTETFGGMPDFGAWTYDGEITVRTATPSNVLYLPYYPTVEQTLEGGRVENTENLREYSFGVRHPLYTETLQFSDREDFDVSLGVASVPADPADHAQTGAQRYTQLPSDTRRWAVAYLNAHFETSLLFASDNFVIAKAIAGHVRDLVPYDTATPRMSGDYDDFAQWFLEEAETGYCVHFASAAAVLLRAAGVPARYVTGYMFTAEAGETVEVTADQAHAWVEYYHEELNTWIVLESTPADLREEGTEPPATEPEETEPPTEPPADETQATRPDGDRPGTDQPHRPDLTWLRTSLKWAVGIALAWILTLAQYRIRRDPARRGSPNTRALHKWQSVERLCRITKQTPPEELEDLAQKAKFSQYTLTDTELQTFDTWLDAEHAKPMPWYLGFVCKYVLAVW